jgi:FKBP-type peptidyl-prolyl cis-trans isomerase FklB
MKSIILTVLLLIDTAISQDSKTKSSVSDNSAPGSTLIDEKAKVSYSLGVDIGRTLKKFQLDLDPNVLNRGISDTLSNKPLSMSDEELQQTLQSFQQQMMQKQQAALAKKQEEMKSKAERNRADGQKFLDDNAKRPGVRTLSSGLQYKVIKQGSGGKPLDSDVVETNYRGTLIDGTEFDSSDKHGSTSSFPVNGVIKGWSEALKLMTVGSKWEIYVPPDLAYGDEGAGDDIPPGATLIFEVELLKIKQAAEGGR